MLWFVLAILLVWFFISFFLFRKHIKALKKSVTAKSQATAAQKIKNWTAEYLESKRLDSDDLADRTVQHVFNHNNEKEIVDQLFVTLTNNKQKLPDSLPPEIKEYFETSAILPDWADEDLLNYGQHFYLENGLLICMLLFYKSLPECYTGAKGAAVLLKTAQLNDRSANLDKLSWRLAYTGVFIFRVMNLGALKPRKGGVVATQKIRMIHAVARYYILNSKRASWDKDNLGLPINQEDMAGTLMAFSALVLEGLEMLGVKISLEERESYIHCWRVIGHILGVKKELIPANSEDALALGHAIIKHQKGASVAGVQLTDALLNFCNKKSPFFISEGFHRSMMRHLMGEELADMLNLKADNPNSKKFIAYVERYIKLRERAKKYLFLCFILQKVDRFLLWVSYHYLSKTPLRKMIRFRLPNDVDLLSKR